MEKRVVLFITLAFAVLVANFFVMRWIEDNFKPPVVAQANAAKDDAAPEADANAEIPGAEGQPADDSASPPPAAEVSADEPVAPANDAAAAMPAAMLEQPAAWVTLGSLDDQSPYRMLVTLNARGAAVERIELNSPRYLDADELEARTRGGYLGHLSETDAADSAGCAVNVVPPGSPAATAKLAIGDIITSVAGSPVRTALQFRLAMGKTRPGQVIEIEVLRGGEMQKLSARLRRFPLSVIRPEGTDPLSFLLTLSAIGDRGLTREEEEFRGMAMKASNWRLLPRDPAKPDEAAFEFELPGEGLAVVKRYSLEPIPADQIEDANFPGFHLNLQVELRNTGDQPLRAAYRMDGPNGLPIEGWWYAMTSKISPNMRGGAGLRDVAVGFLQSHGLDHNLVSCESIIDGNVPNWQGEPIIYIGVDAQYFASVLIPQVEKVGDDWIANSTAIRAGPIPADSAMRRLTNVSCRIETKPVILPPGEAPLVQKYKIFAGPKKPAILAAYARPFGLEKLIEFGWFGWVARPMLAILHAFHAVLGNYGLAIIMLTVLVRSCMLPVSYKQTMNAQKMQELQPEIKRIAEKYKSKPEERMKAQQELFRKHKYNPLSGCLPVFLQLPIFIGLYRSLAVDVELRQAPLITESLGWATNLAAPDMLWYWGDRLPAFLVSPLGWLGPFFNLLPCFTIALFLIQQKMFMPPPTDEQTAMQARIMKYMMVFIGVMFFKVASGLCVYFIASSLWGIAERKLLPKKALASGDAVSAEPTKSKSNGLFSLPGFGGAQTNGAAKSNKRRQRDRR